MDVDKEILFWHIYSFWQQVLTLFNKNNQGIKGIVIGNSEYKMTQFADDTSLISDGTTNSLAAALNILEIFGSISGIKVNTEKTQIIWIGKKKHSKEKNACKSYTWKTVTDFKLLGIIFSIDLDKCPDLNFLVKKGKIKENISQWNKSYLTPLSKVTVIKTF